MATSFSSLGRRIACIFLFVSFSLLLLPFSESIDFEFTRFVSDTKNIQYSGDAVPSAGAIELNRVDDLMRVGHVQYVEPVRIWDRKSRELSDFTTHFTFVIDTQNQSKYGDAFAFYLAPVGFQIPPNSAGRYLGLFNSTTYNWPQNQIIVVEFDTVVNPDFDPPYGHVGININSVSSAKTTAWNVSFHSGDPGDAWVSYNSTTQLLNLSLRYGTGNQSTDNTNLWYKVDLRDVLPEWVTIGFSGTTGMSKEKHTLQYWEFSSSLKSEQERGDNSINWKLIVGLSVPLFALVVGGLVAYAIIWRIQRKIANESEDIVALTSINDDLDRGTGPKKFPFGDLALATNNFAYDQKLGEGGFGCVYKGYLSSEGIMVAVKKISQGSKQGKKEYTTEVKIISSLRHRNLVQLIGWCHDETQFLLVYEFMPNGSLDSHLFNKKSILKWDVRYNIATGLASALLYLHEECEQCVVHRDIKASNIMLDSGFNAKLGDFGLARLMDHELGLKTTGLAGTLGYMAPEYAVTGKASKESDVYSFGVVVLEIVCGKKATDKVDPHSDLRLVEWVWGLLGKNVLLSGVDQLLNKEFNTTEVERLMMVGLWCSHPDRSLRPSIRQAIQVLKFEGALPNLPTKMPVPIYYSVPDGSEISSSSATMTNSSIDMAR
ncbi:putative protein kinase RLK-Pelle-L-LEC family [Helianthus annuus]|uniref:Putative concanavalin A-like lectin/glucanase domain-containing protein n=1 Tax=Helianthus annuus TaxID=4232 RepID=A0A251SVB8_HELAN|nr:L-type lectin-domain containing receptor kinase IX.1 [Helianthus annuus]KAF5774482.1 putative protein kinase RLK-Pelle-L-LEC family [Helianthus annuus]KAJ0482422.1 putative protein kinase RLK-Pelle-L-LEC family [Helianthus annuus]KAJ0850292.1 putative protein kinase RLK-Pelle-L-LEC family [Helianthus annuus]KAJ0859360.1 putative protein kinase RLK-Pelle-L-LEC family [Helianthus annuus]